MIYVGSVLGAFLQGSSLRCGPSLSPPWRACERRIRPERTITDTYAPHFSHSRTKTTEGGSQPDRQTDSARQKSAEAPTLAIWALGRVGLPRRRSARDDATSQSRNNFYTPRP